MIINLTASLVPAKYRHLTNSHTSILTETCCKTILRTRSLEKICMCLDFPGMIYNSFLNDRLLFHLWNSWIHHMKYSLRYFESLTGPPEVKNISCNDQKSGIWISYLFFEIVETVSGVSSFDKYSIHLHDNRQKWGEIN